MATAVVGIEINASHQVLELVLNEIARSHSDRCAAEGTPCHWRAGWLDAVLCDLEKSLERQHVREAEAPIELHRKMADENRRYTSKGMHPPRLTHALGGLVAIP
jgi:hypothetical protein